MDEKNESYNLIQLPARKEFIWRKWVFKNKLNAYGKVEKYESYFVEKGYSQGEGSGFGEIFVKF